MLLSTFLLVCATAMLVDAQAFKGSPAGEGISGAISSFPTCAGSCLNTPKANSIDQFNAFCLAISTKDCCIIDACAQEDQDLTYQISAQICNYINVQVAPLTCAPTSTIMTDATAPPMKGPDRNIAAASSASSVSTKAQTTTVPTSSLSTQSSLRSSTHSTLLTSTRSSTRSSTNSSIRSSTRSSTHASSAPVSTASRVTTSSATTKNLVQGSSTSTAPPSAHSTLSVYNGFVGAYCYTEGTNGRALTGNSTSSSKMTIETCLDFCEKTGWGWAGLENSSDCYCGYGMGKGSVRAADSVCNLGCAGNPTENCGGTNALSVYQSG